MSPHEALLTSDVSTKAPEKAPESCSSVEWIIARTKCRIFGIETKHEASVAQRQLRASIEATPAITEKKTRLNMAELAEIQPYIGKNTMTRMLLFGTSNSVIEKNGTFSSESDRKAWSAFESAPPERNEKSALYKKLSKIKWQAIKLDSNIAVVDFRQNLKDLWEEKIRRYGNKNPDLRKFYETRVLPTIEQKQPWTKISLKELESSVDKEINLIKQALLLTQGLKKAPYSLTEPRKQALATKFIANIKASDLIELSMTEIMDKNGSKFNNKLYDTLLRKWGLEYLALIPALGDPEISFGNYQHTRMSVGGRNIKWTEAAAITADRVFTGKKLLGDSSIENFPIEHHHRAAYLLAIHNIAVTVRMLPETDTYTVVTAKKIGKKIKKEKHTVVTHPLATLENVLKKDPHLASTIMLQYFAASHNNPANAFEGLTDWLEAYEKTASKAGDRLGKHIDLVATRGNADRQKSNSTKS